LFFIWNIIGIYFATFCIETNDIETSYFTISALIQVLAPQWRRLKSTQTTRIYYMTHHSFAALSLIIACSSSFAAVAQDKHNNSQHSSFNNSSCETNLNADMKFSDNELTVITRSKQTVMFDGSGRVIVDGETISLSASEKSLAQRYYNDVEQAIPMVTSIAVEAINITNMALTEVFTGLLGENSALPQMIDERLGSISKAIQEHVYQNPDSLTFDTHYFEEDLGFDSSLDNKIDEITEELMSTAMGEVLMALGKAMMTNGSNMSDFETRMEKMGKDIETRADALALELEEKAESLCNTLQAIDETENKLQSIEPLSDLNMVEVFNKKA
jgi:hypothetical protein